MYKKKLEDMNLLDNFLMNIATTDQEVGEKLCRCMLSVLLQRRIGHVRVISERFIPPYSPEHRGIRLDVEVTDVDECDNNTIARVYDVEPHTDNDMDFPRANRFRQAKIDSRYMESGDDDFSHLPDLYVITITNFDIFRKDHMIYTFRTVCDEDSSIAYDDGVKWIYFNTKGKKGGSKSIHNMLEYIQDSSSKSVVDDATAELDGYINKVKTDPEIRRNIMTFGNLIDKEVKKAVESEVAEAVKNTVKENTRDNILDVLNDLGEVSDKLVIKLDGVESAEELKSILKLAAKSDSISEFEKKLDERLTVQPGSLHAMSVR